jgi:mono/diheme cytochrome c family protein
MTRTNAAVSGVAWIIALLAIAVALPRAQAGAPAKPAAGARQGGAPDQAAVMRGGGRDANPTAALFIEQCSGCHGTDLAGGRAPSLFNEQWLASTTDERIANAIRNGVPNTAMAPFKSLSDEQIWQLTQYMRTQSGVRGNASLRSSSLWTAR